MCLIFFALKEHAQYKFILAGNRDEFYQRKTAAASFWADHPSIVGGRDLEAGGTWLGMNKNGRIAMVTNYRDLKNLKQTAPSRGHLVSEFLEKAESPKNYLEKIQPTAQEYNGFNLLVGDQNGLSYLSNYKKGIDHLSKGVYGLSNHLLDSPWPKVVKGKKKFTEIISRQFMIDDLFEFLRDEERASDDKLPDTGIGLEKERALSAMFIKSPGYGSRCSTVILVDQEDNASFNERVYDTETFRFTTNSFSFRIQHEE